MDFGSRRYGEAHDEPDIVTVSAKALLREQKPDWLQVLKFSRLTETFTRQVVSQQPVCLSDRNLRAGDKKQHRMSKHRIHGEFGFGAGWTKGIVHQNIVERNAEEACGLERVVSGSRGLKGGCLDGGDFLAERVIEPAI